MRLVEFSLAHRIPVACFHAIKSTKFKRQWNLLLHRNLLFQVSFCIYWLTFICTDTTLSEEEIIRVYGKRWQIEVFFKTCKSMLNLIGECRSLSYDALTAHVAIVFTRYMLLAMEQRQNEDQRTLGELFFFLVDEMADITFHRSLGILMDALMASLQEILKLSDEQLTAFTADFEARLPEYLRNALHPKAVVA